MKLFTKLKSFSLLLATLIVAGCSNSTPQNNNQPTGPAIISISAAGEYPVGYNSVATFIVSNDAPIVATNLKYSIINDSTGAKLNVNGDKCATIAANGGSCILSVNVPSTATQGGFTLVERPAFASSGDNLQSSTANVASATVGLSSTIGFEAYPFIIMPSTQIVVANGKTPTSFLISVLVNSNDVNTLSLVDDNGDNLKYTPVGNISLTKGSVNTYRVTPAFTFGQTSQIVQIASDVCNSSQATSCSNQSTTTIAQNGVGFMTISPENFVMNSVTTTQAVTLTNPSNGAVTITKIGLGSVAGLSYESGTCLPFMQQYSPQGWRLPAGASCSVNVNYAPSTTYGTAKLTVAYTNGQGAQANVANVIYYPQAQPFSILTTNPDVVNLTGSVFESVSVVTVTNVPLFGSTESITISTLTPAVLGGVTSVSNDTCSGSQLGPWDTCSFQVGYSHITSTSGTTSINIVDTNGSQAMQINYLPTSVYAYVVSNSLQTASAANSIFVYNKNFDALPELLTYSNESYDYTSTLGAYTLTSFHPVDAQFSNGYLYVANLDSNAASSIPSVLLYQVESDGSLTFQSSLKVLSTAQSWKNASFKISVAGDIVYAALNNSVYSSVRNANTLSPWNKVIGVTSPVSTINSITVRPSDGVTYLGLYNSGYDSNSLIYSYLVAALDSSIVWNKQTKNAFQPGGGVAVNNSKSINGMVAYNGYLYSGDFLASPAKGQSQVMNYLLSASYSKLTSPVINDVLLPTASTTSITQVNNLAVSQGVLFASFVGVSPSIAFYRISKFDGSLSSDPYTNYTDINLSVPTMPPGGTWSPAGIAFNLQ